MRRGRRSELVTAARTCFALPLERHTNKPASCSAPSTGIRHRIVTPSLRGVQIQRLFGSQRPLKTVEDFTQFEQAGSLFHGVTGDRHQEGHNPLARLSRRHGGIPGRLGFPPAPKLDVFGGLDPSTGHARRTAWPGNLLRQGRCGTCPPTTYYTQSDADLKIERFFPLE